LIDSERVQKRLGDEKRSTAAPADVLQLLTVSVDLRPEGNELRGIWKQDELAIEIPTNVEALQVEEPDLVVEWRKATRQAFIEAMTLGYVVEEFYRCDDGDKSLGRYLLRRMPIEKLV
jgi:predicted GNAT superfamily acetyltransferase